MGQAKGRDWLPEDRCGEQRAASLEMPQKVPARASAVTHPSWKQAGGGSSGGRDFAGRAVFHWGSWGKKCRIRTRLMKALGKGLKALHPG